MKDLPFQGQELLPLTLDVRILKFWNPTACPVLLPPFDPLSLQNGRVRLKLKLRVPQSNIALKLKALCKIIY